MTENASQEPANDNDRHGQDSDGCNFDRPVSRCCLQFVFLFITVEKYFLLAEIVAIFLWTIINSPSEVFLVLGKFTFESKSLIHNLYSLLGTLFQNSQKCFEQCVHPQVLNCSGFSFFIVSQSISILNLVANVPGANINGEHGPSAKSFNLSLYVCGSFPPKQ